MLATQPDIDTVAVTRTFDGIEAAAHRVISHIGGMASVIKDTKIAVLKPNFVAGRSANTGATTSFALLYHEGGPDLNPTSAQIESWSFASDPDSLAALRSIAAELHIQRRF